MSANYKTVNWNRNKLVYDWVMWASVAAFIVIFVLITNSLYRGDNALSMPIVLMRALSSCAFLMLTLILCIGPLARISPVFLPLLYNRRHLGVTFFIVALMHAAVAIFWYHSFGVQNPLVSVFTSGGSYQPVAGIPFQAFGAIALLLLFVMAATSHDYWNKNLQGPLWKALHMLVYPAYALVVLHIIFGALQQDNTGILPWAVAISVALVGGLHIIAATRFSNAAIVTDDAEWVDLCHWNEIENNRGMSVDVGDGERVAVFRFDENKLCAVANACQHQNGPLAEGCVVNGNIVCPWHGYEYRPADGQSPAPFTEKIETYHLKLVGDRVQLNPRPLPPGTARPLVEIPQAAIPEPRHEQ